MDLLSNTKRDKEVTEEELFAEKRSWLNQSKGRNGKLKNVKIRNLYKDEISIKENKTPKRVHRNSQISANINRFRVAKISISPFRQQQQSQQEHQEHAI